MTSVKGRGAARGTLYSIQEVDKRTIKEPTDFEDWLMYKKWIKTPFDDNAVSAVLPQERSQREMDGDPKVDKALSALSPNSRPIAVPPRPPVERAKRRYCTRCKVSVATQMELEAHYDLSPHHNICHMRTQGCCDFDGKTEKVLQLHLKRSEHGFACYGCDIGFRYGNDREVHLIKNHACQLCHAHHDNWQAMEKHSCNEIKSPSPIPFETANAPAYQTTIEPTPQTRATLIPKTRRKQLYNTTAADDKREDKQKTSPDAKNGESSNLVESKVPGENAQERELSAGYDQATSEREVLLSGLRALRESDGPSLRSEPPEQTQKPEQETEVGLLENGTAVLVQARENRDNFLNHISSEPAADTTAKFINGTDNGNTPQTPQPLAENLSDGEPGARQKTNKKCNSTVQSQEQQVQCFACHVNKKSIARVFKHLERSQCPAMEHSPGMAAVLIEHWYPWHLQVPRSKHGFYFYCPCCHDHFKLASSAVQHMRTVQTSKSMGQLVVGDKVKPCDQVLKVLHDHLDNVLSKFTLFDGSSKSPFALAQTMPKQLPIYHSDNAHGEDRTEMMDQIKENVDKQWKAMLANRAVRDGFNQNMWSMMYGRKHNWENYWRPPSHLELFTDKKGRKVFYWISDGKDTGPQLQRSNDSEK